MDKEQATPSPGTVDRLQLLKDVVVFQAKLALDGVLDFLLIPVSFAAAIVSFFVRGEHADAFYRVVASGARADRWIDLFAAARDKSPADGPGQGSEPSMDDIVARIETYLRREYDEGRLPGPARSTIDSVLKRLRGETDRDSLGRHG